MQVWAPSYCRSTLAFYEALAAELHRPLRVCIGRSGMGERGAIGFKDDEFAHLEIVDVSSGEAAGKALEERADWPQLFGIYQTMPHIRKVIHLALDRGCRVGIASEAPCNMDAPGAKRAARATYLRHVAPIRFARVVQGADFIINWSGDAAKKLIEMGWHQDQIVPCGYFPPPLPGSVHQLRPNAESRTPHILCTGSLTWHRGPDVLMQALELLKAWGIVFRATFTGKGPLEAPLRAHADRLGIDCRFAGSVPLADLVELYQTCSIFVAPGREEPWGMRVNDALNCGAPCVVSRGMGASKLILDFGLGTTFYSGDHVDLAWQIRRLLEDTDQYEAICSNFEQHIADIRPHAAAARATVNLGTRLALWRGSSPK